MHSVAISNWYFNNNWLATVLIRSLNISNGILLSESNVVHCFIIRFTETRCLTLRCRLKCDFNGLICNYTGFKKRP